MRSKAERSAINLAYYYKNREKMLATMKYTRRLKIKKVHCDYCNSLFRPSKHFKKFCSDECRANATPVRESRLYRCAYCNNWHETYRDRQRYCSRSCKDKARYKERGFKMNIRKRAVNKVLRDLATVRNVLYSEEELDFIRKNLDKMSIKEIALTLGRSYSSVSHKTPGIRAEKLRKKRSRRKKEDWE